MQNQALASYIRTERNAGRQLQDIKDAAKRAGWSDADISAALADSSSRPSEILSVSSASNDSQWWKLVVIVLAAGGLAYVGWSRLGQSGINPPTAQPAASSAPAAPIVTAAPQPSVQLMQSTGQLFSSSPYNRRAYLIFPGTPSAAAQRALDGFDMQTADLVGGATRVSLVAKAGDYPTQSFVIGSGQTLYMVETSFGDDNPSQDYVYGDDFGVAVDQNGYMLQ